MNILLLISKYWIYRKTGNPIFRIVYARNYSLIILHISTSELQIRKSMLRFIFRITNPAQYQGVETFYAQHWI